MTNQEFKAKLTEVFKAHMFMDARSRHTVNELLWVLRYDGRFDGENFNISISMLDGAWRCIPSIDFFVDIASLSVWFEDERVEFEVEDCGDEKYNCITVYECKKEE
jgi:hypothetical protein